MDTVWSTEVKAGTRVRDLKDEGAFAAWVQEVRVL
jgi:hypothetical protein